MDFFKQTGYMAIGSRLRLLTDHITEEATQIYKLCTVELKTKWFPVFFVLSQNGLQSVTEIAKQIGHSHPSVSKIIKEMNKACLVQEQTDVNDARRTLISLSKKGKSIALKLEDQCADITSAIEKIIQHTTHNLWQAIEEWEFLLNEQSLLKRVSNEKKLRESKMVKIVPYCEEHQSTFRMLNETWIKKYFEMEIPDYQVLDNPKQFILDKGGYIFVALYPQQDVVGVCALIKLNDGQHDFELAKMAVSPNAQGKNIGFLLGQAALNKAKDVGATKVYLESNTILKPAIGLYQKLGFKKIVAHNSPYKRCNIQMEKQLKDE